MLGMGGSLPTLVDGEVIQGATVLPPIFFALQVPLADIRPFCPGQTYRLTLPTWPDAEPGRQFVRSVGGIYPRPRGSPGVWPGENSYCDASQAVRFAPGLRNQGLLCRFRRLYGNGNGMLRFELGLTRRAARNNTLDRLDRRSYANADGLVELLRYVLDLQVSVPQSDRPDRIRLAQIDSPLATALLNCTSSSSAVKTGRLDKSWLTAGRMLVLLEWPRSYWPESEAITTVSQPLRGISLNHLKLWHGNRLINVWAMGVGRNAAPNDLRSLRIHLFRLHAEREILRQTLRLLAQGKLTVERGTDASDRLQRFLTQAVQALRKDVRYDVQQSEILHIAYGYDDLVAEGDVPSLQQSLSDARRHVSRLVEGYVADTLGQTGPLSVHIERAYLGEVISVSDQSKNVRIGNVGGSITGIVGIDSTITDSFKRIETSDADEQLKALLAQLVAAVSEVVKRIPESAATAAGRDLNDFTQEATSERPRKGVLEALGNGLKQAAELVGEIGGPVVKLVTAIVALF
jgi:hypothetical protein